MKKKQLVVLLLLVAMVAVLSACGGNKKEETETVSHDVMVDTYGFQWKDTSAPILNEKGAKEISFNIYSSKNASALDYNDMKIMQDLFKQTNVTVNWENVSESVYAQQKNLKIGDKNGRPDALYHAGISAGEVIKYAKRKVFVPISDYLEYMPNFSKLLEERPDIRKQITNVEDGKIYTLPRIEEMGLLQNPNLLFLNVSWTKQAIEAGAVTGLSVDDLKDGLTLTCAQMEQILTYFRRKHTGNRAVPGVAIF